MIFIILIYWNEFTSSLSWSIVIKIIVITLILGLWLSQIGLGLWWILTMPVTSLNGHIGEKIF